PDQPTPWPQLGKAPAQAGELPDEIAKIFAVPAQIGPLHPSGLVVLAIRVVVAVLAVADLIAGEQQRNPLRQYQAGEEIPAQPAAQLDHGRIVARPFDPAIAAEILRGAVAIVLPVGLVVLLRIADQVHQREAVVDGHMIAAGARPAAMMPEPVGRRGHARAEIADQVALAAPEPSERLPVGIVPFRPAGREGTQLISARAEIPRLRDQLD